MQSRYLECTSGFLYWYALMLGQHPAFKNILCARKRWIGIHLAFFDDHTWYRPSVYFTARADGIIDAWDILLQGHRTPSFSYQVYIFRCNTLNLQIRKRAVIDEVNTFFQCSRRISYADISTFCHSFILTTIDNLLVWLSVHRPLIITWSPVSARVLYSPHVGICNTMWKRMYLGDRSQRLTSPQ